MDLRFDVGVRERHEVVFSFDKFWGTVKITVDGVPATRGFRVASISLVKRYQLSVGAQERHDVVIEKHRARVFAGFRPQVCRAYVDGQLVAEGVA